MRIKLLAFSILDRCVENITIFSLFKKEEGLQLFTSGLLLNCEDIEEVCLQFFYKITSPKYQDKIANDEFLRSLTGNFSFKSAKIQELILKIIYNLTTY